MLMAVLQDDLKAAGLLTKDVKKQLSSSPQRPVKPQGEYDTNDTENAFRNELLEKKYKLVNIFEYD